MRYSSNIKQLFRTIPCSVEHLSVINSKYVHCIAIFLKTIQYNQQSNFFKFNFSITISKINDTLGLGKKPIILN